MSKDTGFSITSAERYSLALFELSEENNLLSQIEDQSSSILNLIEKSEDFSNLIKDPTTSQEDLLKVINTISEKNKFESLFKNFLNFLIQKRRFFFIERILKSFIEICSKKRGELKAELKEKRKREKAIKLIQTEKEKQKQLENMRIIKVNLIKRNLNFQKNKKKHLKI